MAKKKKYYVIWNGHETGVFDSWDVVKELVKGVPGAKYKSFKTKEAAEEAYTGYHGDFISKNAKTQNRDFRLFEDEIDMESISVDAACSGNPGIMEYRGVYTKDQFELFHQGPFKQGTNNIGEFLALVHAMALLNKRKDAQTSIYSDSKIAIGWVRKKKANTKLAKTKSNGSLFQLIDRAEQWLKANEFKNEILKWNTKKWGEIPADFGRK